MRRWLVVAVALLAFGSVPLAEGPSVEVLFVRPEIDGVIQDAIVSALEGAESTVDIAIFVFTDTDPALLNAVLDAHERGVEVRTIFNRRDAGQDYSAFHSLCDAGVPVARPFRTHTFHHKFIVVDGELVITGSYNWSASANTTNWENAVVIRCAEVAGAYTVEFDYLWGTFDVGCPPPPPPPVTCEACLDRINRATAREFGAIDRIGDVLSARLVAHQPYTAVPCTIPNIMRALERVDGIGETLSERIVRHFCPELF